MDFHLETVAFVRSALWKCGKWIGVGQACVQSSFTALKIPCSAIHPSHSPAPGNYDFFLWLNW